MGVGLSITKNDKLQAFWRILGKFVYYLKLSTLKYSGESVTWHGVGLFSASLCCHWIGVSVYVFWVVEWIFSWDELRKPAAWVIYWVQDKQTVGPHVVEGMPNPSTSKERDECEEFLKISIRIGDLAKFVLGFDIFWSINLYCFLKRCIACPLRAGSGDRKISRVGAQLSTTLLEEGHIAEPSGRSSEGSSCPSSRAVQQPSIQRCRHLKGLPSTVIFSWIMYLLWWKTSLSNWRKENYAKTQRGSQNGSFHIQTDVPWEGTTTFPLQTKESVSVMAPTNSSMHHWCCLQWSKAAHGHCWLWPACLTPLLAVAVGALGCTPLTCSISDVVAWEWTFLRGRCTRQNPQESHQRRGTDNKGSWVRILH